MLEIVIDRTLFWSTKYNCTIYLSLSSAKHYLKDLVLNKLSEKDEI